MRFLKTIASVVILVCLFLPLSHCSMQTQAVTDSKTNKLVTQSGTVNRDVIVSNSIFGGEAEISIESLILPIAFIVPVIFSLLPNFSKKKRVLKLVVQFIFAVWFAYTSYHLVFSIGRPLVAGWFLNVASVLFLLLCFLELLLMKHNKFNNENTVNGSDVSSTRHESA